jgi:predicted MPP superfamily phosphohydrolase
MRSSHLVLILLGLGTQALGWGLLPRKARRSAWLACLALDVLWMLWYARDGRSLSVSGVWALSPLATWFMVHLLLGPIVAVEALARSLPWPRMIRVLGLGLLLGGYAWGLAEAYGTPVVTRVTLAFPDLPPAFDGYRIVLFGDIHAGLYAGTRTVGRWARVVGRIPCDLIVGDGDFVTHVPEEAERTGVAFESLHPPDGKVGVLGNHDEYSRTDEVAQRLEDHGWDMLLDRDEVIERQGQRLVLLGTRYPAEDRMAVPPDWKGRPWPGGFRIGICHSPEQWPMLVKEGARLTLAAHTHGGQVNLSPFYNAGLERMPWVYGLYRQGSARLFVTRGLGCTTLPFRFRCRPEIVVITLHRGA